MSPFGANSSLRIADGTRFLERPHDPAGEEHQRHRQRHVEVGVGAPEQRLVDHEAVRRLMSPSDGAHAGDQADPVGGEDEEEERPKEPERLLHEVRADDALEQPVETFDQPFQQVLRARGDLGHAPRRHLREHDQAQRDDPRHDHGIGDREAERRAISTAFCDRPCSAGAWAAANATVDHPSARDRDRGREQPASATGIGYHVRPLVSDSTRRARGRCHAWGDARAVTCR